jgi:hypothetical protein
VTEKQRVRALAFGSFCLTMSVYLASIWLLAEINPNGSYNPSFLGIFVGLFFGTSVFLTLRPLIPCDPA